MQSLRIAYIYMLKQRVVARWVAAQQGKNPPKKKPSFDDWAKKGEPYTHPKTRNDVGYKSLPDDAKSKLKDKYESEYGPIEDDGPGLFPVTEKLLDALDKVQFGESKTRQKIVHAVGGFMSKVLKTFTQNRLAKAADKVIDKTTGVLGEVTIGGEKTEYSEQKNYQIMGRVLGNKIAPGSFKMTPEEEKVGNQYFVHTLQSMMPLSLGKAAGALGAGLATAFIPVIGPPLAPLVAIAATLATNSQVYKKIDRDFSTYWKKKGKDFDEVTASYINGYTTMDSLSKSYEDDIKSIEDDSNVSGEEQEQQVHDRYMKYLDEMKSARKAQKALSKYAKGKDPDFEDAAQKVLSDAIRFGFEGTIQDLQDNEDAQEEYADETRDWIKRQIELHGPEKATELAQKQLDKMGDEDREPEK